MSIEILKLELIQKISVCDDPQILAAIGQLLGNYKKEIFAESQENNLLINTLLEQSSSSKETVSDNDLKDLQDSINDVFLKE